MRLFQRRFTGLLLTAALGTVLTAGGSAVFALVMYIFFDDLRFAGLLSTAACTAGSFYGSYIGGKFRRRRGLAGGIAAGALMWCVFAAVSLSVTGSVTGIRKLMLLTVSGGAGGVSGVNSKRPGKLM